jgi:hypothetical protein
LRRGAEGSIWPQKGESKRRLENILVREALEQYWKDEMKEDKRVYLVVCLREM